MKNTDKNNFNATIGNTVLCDGLLIPMTDFVIEIDENKPKFKNFSSFCEINQYERNGYDKIRNYATFLQQPLKLEMFVPCDDKGNVWEYPPTKEEWEWAQKDSADAEQSFKQKEYYYEKAKEKVLFEFKPQFDISIIKHHISQGRNIEYLANFGSMQLTQTALNSIFGETIA